MDNKALEVTEVVVERRDTVIEVATVQTTCVEARPAVTQCVAYPTHTEMEFDQCFA